MFFTQVMQWHRKIFQGRILIAWTNCCKKERPQEKNRPICKQNWKNRAQTMQVGWWKCFSLNHSYGHEGKEKRQLKDKTYHIHFLRPEKNESSVRNPYIKVNLAKIQFMIGFFNSWFFLYLIKNFLLVLESKWYSSIS